LISNKVYLQTAGRACSQDGLTIQGLERYSGCISKICRKERREQYIIEGKDKSRKKEFIYEVVAPLAMPPVPLAMPQTEDINLKLSEPSGILAGIMMRSDSLAKVKMTCVNSSL